VQLIREFINFRNIKIVTDDTPGDFPVNGELSIALFMHTSNEHSADVTVMNCRNLLLFRGIVQPQLQLRVKNCLTPLLVVLQEIDYRGCIKPFILKYETFMNSYQTIIGQF
jgi:hypothetical protein